MTTDRLGVTVTPYTLDAGRFQFESDVINYSRDTDVWKDAYFEQEATVRRFRWSPALRFGVADGIELRASLLYFDEYTKWQNRGFYWDGTPATGQSEDKRDWFDAVRAGLKLRVFETDDGRFTAAILPGALIPVDNSRYFDVSPFVQVPIAYRLPQGWEVQFASSLTSHSMRGSNPEMLNWHNSINVSKQATEKLTVFGEVSGEYIFDAPSYFYDWLATVGFGAAYQVCPQMQLDAGIRFGLFDRPPDYNPFLGVSVRF